MLRISPKMVAVIAAVAFFALSGVGVTLCTVTVQAPDGQYYRYNTTTEGSQMFAVLPNGILADGYGVNGYMVSPNGTSYLIVDNGTDIYALRSGRPLPPLLFNYTALGAYNSSLSLFDSDTFESDAEGWTGGAVSAGVYADALFRGAPGTDAAVFTKKVGTDVYNVSVQWGLTLGSIGGSSANYDISLYIGSVSASNRVYSKSGTMLSPGSVYGTAEAFGVVNDTVIIVISAGSDALSGTALIDNCTFYGMNLSPANTATSWGEINTVYNITLKNEADLSPWGNFTSPWGVNITCLVDGHFVTTPADCSEEVIVVKDVPEWIRAYCYYSTAYYYRQAYPVREADDLTFCLAPQLTDVGQIVFYVYDYVGGFPVGSVFTALKQYDGTYYITDESMIDVSRIAALYLTNGMTYYIRINGSQASFVYGTFTPTVSPVTVHLTTSSESRLLNFTFVRNSETSATAAYEDPSGLTSWVSISISNSTHEIINASAPVSTMILATSMAPQTAWYNATFIYTIEGVNYTASLMLGSMASYSNSTIVPPFDQELTVMGFPILPLGIMFAMLTAGTIFTAYYARYGIAAMAIMLVAFTAWGWIPDMRLAFAGIIGLLAVLYIMGQRGRA